MAFYQPHFTPLKDAELLHELGALSRKYQLSKHDLFHKIAELLEITPQGPATGPVPIPAPKAKAIRSGPARTGQRWTSEEEETMVSMLRAKSSCTAVAEKLERTNVAIASRMGVYAAKHATSTEPNAIIREFNLGHFSDSERETFLKYLDQHLTAKASPPVTMESIATGAPSAGSGTDDSDESSDL